MFSRKAHDVVIMDLRRLTSTADFFVLCSADSDVQVRAIADAVEEETSRGGQGPWHAEGLRGGVWVVLDYVDVVAHIFHRETREYYNLERLWADAPSERLVDPAEPKRTPRARTKKAAPVKRTRKA
jgi:ribosome-associated protein